MSTKRKKDSALKFLEGLTGGPLTFGEMLSSIRQGEEETQKEFAAKLKVSVQHLCNIEKGLKAVSPERAVRFAKALGHSEKQFVRLALQSQLDDLGVYYKVHLEAA